jgi:alginate O-acetyltransferase complex protein AlgJ
MAWREVGHTAIAPWLARVLVVWFLSAVAALPAVEIAGARGAPEGEARRPWAVLAALPRDVQAAASRAASGAALFWDRLVPANRTALGAFTAFETALEDQSTVGRLLRPPAQALLSRWLGAGNERVYVGREGWLFYRPDVEYVTGRGFLDPTQLRRRTAGASELDTPPEPDPRPAIVQFAGDLRQRGIALIVVPTPVKPAVHPERLAPSLGPSDAPVQNLSYEPLLRELGRGGVLVFDPVPALLDASRRTGAPLFLATDTHWRPEAMQAAAEALARFIDERAPLPPVPAPGYRAEPREARHTGDTAAMLDLPEGQTLYPPETVPLRFVVGADGDPWRPSRQADVLVLGDSFSNIYSQAAMGWGEAAGFVEQLSLALGRPVDRIVQNDRGASATRLALAREAADRLVSTRVVVWQFAARELALGDWVVR